MNHAYVVYSIDLVNKKVTSNVDDLLMNVTMEEIVWSVDFAKSEVDRLQKQAGTGRYYFWEIAKVISNTGQ